MSSFHMTGNGLRSHNILGRQCSSVSIVLCDATVQASEKLQGKVNLIVVVKVVNALNENVLWKHNLGCFGVYI